MELEPRIFSKLAPKKEVIISFNIKVCLCNQWVVAFSFPWMFVSKLQDDGSGMRAKTKGKSEEAELESFHVLAGIAQWGIISLKAQDLQIGKNIR